MTLIHVHADSLIEERQVSLIHVRAGWLIHVSAERRERQALGLRLKIYA